MDWDEIIYEWYDSLNREAIAAAIRLAREALEQKVNNYTKAA